jgi:thioredoxin-related protein
MKRLSLTKLQVVIALVLSALCLLTEAQSMPFVLKSLNTVQPVTGMVDDNLATVVMIYQPDCSWCKKQGKTLSMAYKQCRHYVNIALVGTKGNARQLKKELKHYHENIPAFIADRKFLREIGGYQASPTTLIFSAKGELVMKKRGFIAQEKLANAISIISKGSCHI